MVMITYYLLSTK